MTSPLSVALRATLFGLLAALPGCDRPGSSPAPSAAVPAAGSPTVGASALPTSVAQILTQPNTSDGHAALALWARATDLAPELRVAALRRLEEVHALVTVTVGGDLAREPAGLVRDNAIATLVRARTPEAQAVLTTLTPESQALARSLGGGS